MSEIAEMEEALSVEHHPPGSKTKAEGKILHER
jgi:hypothetical protein